MIKNAAYSNISALNTKAFRGSEFSVLDVDVALLSDASDAALLRGNVLVDVEVAVLGNKGDVALRIDISVDLDVLGTNVELGISADGLVDVDALISINCETLRGLHLAAIEISGGTPSELVANELGLLENS